MTIPRSSPLTASAGQLQRNVLPMVRQFTVDVAVAEPPAPVTVTVAIDEPAAVKVRVIVALLLVAALLFQLQAHVGDV